MVPELAQEIAPAQSPTKVLVEEEIKEIDSTIIKPKKRRRGGQSQKGESSVKKRQKYEDEPSVATENSEQR